MVELIWDNTCGVARSVPEDRWIDVWRDGGQEGGVETAVKERMQHSYSWHLN